MTTPRVVELPRRLEPTSTDTFLAGCDSEVLAAVVPLRSRDTSARRAARSRRGLRPTRPTGDPGPGGDAA